jgi:hypothetical protein
VQSLTPHLSHTTNPEGSTMQPLAGAVRAIGYAMLLIAFGLGAAIGPAYAQGSRTRADVAELLRKHDEALNQHNLEGLLSLYAPSPKTVMLGTGPGEKFQGKAEIKTAYTEIFKDFDKGTMTHSCYWKDGGGAAPTWSGERPCVSSQMPRVRRRESMSSTFRWWLRNKAGSGNLSCCTIPMLSAVHPINEAISSREKIAHGRPKPLTADG